MMQNEVLMMLLERIGRDEWVMALAVMALFVSQVVQGYMLWSHIRAMHEILGDKGMEKPLTQRSLLFEVGFLSGTVYKHLHRVACLFQELCDYLPAEVKDKFEQEVAIWVSDLDKDIQEGYGFSILEEKI